MRLAKSKLDAVEARFEAWRAAGPGRRAVPGRLWRAAVALLGRHTPSQVCERLRLNPSRFKQAREMYGRAQTAVRTPGDGGRAVSKSAHRPTRRERAFVELPPLALVRPGQQETLDVRSECRVVLESIGGRRLSVEFARFDPSWLGSVCRLLLHGASA